MTVASPLASGRGLLRSAPFDLSLIVGVSVLALLSGAVVVRWPHLFPLVLFLDLWLLGYHHVVSTFTRLVFDRESFAQHRALVVWLPPVIVAGVLIAGWMSGGWLLASTYLYWQWFHYTRQSYGIERAYRRRGDGGAVGDERAARWAMYLLPLWGIVHRSIQAPKTFLGVELKVIPVPAQLEPFFAAAAIGALVVFGAQVAAGVMRGAPLQAHTLYVVSHCVVFATGYLLLPELDDGWLVINVWHNAQYILFVWLFNTRRFGDGPSPRARLLSFLSQRSRWPLYFAVCLLISTVVYFGLEHGLASLDARSALPIFLIAYQAINFHHYVVDGLIWKMRSRSLRNTLGLETSS